MSDDEIVLNQKQAAYALGISARTLRDWDSLPEPPPRRQGRRGQPNSYPLRELIAWHLDYRIAQLLGDVQGQPLNLEQERARLAKAQADKLELDLKVRERELAPISEMIEVFSKMVAYSRTRLLALPVKAAPMVYGCKSVPQTAEEIRKHVYEALEELSDTKLEDVLNGG